METFKNSPTMERLINELTKLPSIGRKSAQRLAFHILKRGENEALALAHAIVDVKKKIHFCEQCGNITEAKLCSICADSQRDQSAICVVEDVMDIYAFERSGSYNGIYHNLMGQLSPLEGIMPDDLNIAKLIERVEKGNIKEIIIATNPDVGGEATAAYLKDQLKRFNIKITRIGVGIPIGGDLEYAGDVTIKRALEGRRSF